MALNLHLLRIFAMVAQQHSFSRAAQQLMISQPSVSKSVQELELQIGMPLVDRSSRRFALTEAGTLLYSYAQRLFEVEREAEVALDDLLGLARGTLALGGSHTIGTYLLPPLLSRFHQRYPGVHLSLEINNTHSLIRQLRTKALDLVFVEGPVAGADLNIISWRVDRMVTITPLTHPCAADQPISLERLAACPYVQREPGSGTRETVESAFRTRGISPKIAIELSSNQAVKQAVIAGLGISIVSEATIAVEKALGLLTVIEVDGFSLERTLTHVTLSGKPLNKATSAFLALLNEPEP